MQRPAQPQAQHTRSLTPVWAQHALSGTLLPQQALLSSTEPVLLLELLQAQLQQVQI
jgi:hypothetical protein